MLFLPILVGTLYHLLHNLFVVSLSLAVANFSADNMQFLEQQVISNIHFSSFAIHEQAFNLIEISFISEESPTICAYDQ